jgi:hypothetical protein
MKTGCTRYTDSDWFLTRFDLGLGSAVPADVKLRIRICDLFFTPVKYEYARGGILKPDDLLMTSADSCASATVWHMFQCKFEAGYIFPSRLRCVHLHLSEYSPKPLHSSECIAIYHFINFQFMLKHAP